jgi:predicted ATP-dependent endonuclease of OLD family
VKTNKIKSFSVYGLFGTDDVHIPFNDDVKILIGENGLGKTHILNIFYYTLTRNFQRLQEFSFEKLVLEFANRNKIEISKNSISTFYGEIYKNSFIKDFIEEYGFPQFEKIKTKFYNTSNNKNSRRKLEQDLEYSSRFRKYPYHRIFRVLEELEISKGFSQENLFTSEFENTIRDSLKNNDIMYFPTYRRVEEDLHNLGYDEDEILNQENTLIQFGMDDVQRRFNDIESTIDKSIKDGFSNFSSELVNQFFKDDETSEYTQNKDFLANIDEKDIEILLSRIGNKISDVKKEKIKEMVLNKETQTKDHSLNLLLRKLIENYSTQKELDNSVKAFRDICNKYLVNKKIFYDESAIKIYVKSDRNKLEPEIKLNMLSSGEKQIISMFSKIYLSDNQKRFIVLFDEPELSLSMTWQKQLLPDILNSKKCDFLLAVTHSPFIFDDNGLENFAIGLNEYVKPLEMEMIS